MSKAPTPRERPDPLPVAILTGFLGAGKTTLLNRLVKEPAMADAAIVINEFGEIGIDHALVEAAEDNVFEMAAGCVCCTIRGDLADTLGDLVKRRDSGAVRKFDRVIIETTGLADPAPILHTVMSHPFLAERFRLDGVICIVDCVNGEATLDAHEEAVKQAALAERIVLTKADLLVGVEGEDTLQRLIVRLRKLNPAARIVEATTGEARVETLFNAGLYDAEKRSVDARAWLAAESYAASRRGAERKAARARRAGHGAHGHGDHDHHDVNRHDDHIRAFAIANDRAISVWGLELFLELLRSYHGPNLLRVKGLIKVDDDETRPLVIHGVQHVFHPPTRLAAWPDDDHTSRLVFITRDIERDELDKLFAAFTDPVGGGAAAFADDTLSLRRQR